MAKLQASERYKLTKLIEAEYAKRALTDEEFARFAIDALGFEINAGGVQFARESIGLLSTRQIKREAGKFTIESRLDNAEKAILRLVAMVHQIRGTEP